MSCVSYSLTTKKGHPYITIHWTPHLTRISLCFHRCPLSFQNPNQGTSFAFSAHVSFASSGLSFSDFPWIHGPQVLRSIGQLFCWMSLSLGLPDLFLMLEQSRYAFGGRIPKKLSTLHILSNQRHMIAWPSSACQVLKGTLLNSHISSSHETINYKCYIYLETSPQNVPFGQWTVLPLPCWDVIPIWNH